RRRGQAAAPDHWRVGVQRDLLHRRRRAEGEPARRNRWRVARGDDDPVARTRYLRLCPRRRARRRGPQARGSGPRARRHRRAGARPCRTRVDRTAGAPLHQLSRPGRPRAHRRARPRGVGRKAPVVRGEPAPHQARHRDHRTGGAGGRWRRGACVLAPSAAAQPRQHHRGRHVGDPAEHHRRACPRPAPEPLMDFSFSPEQDQLRAQARSFLEKSYPLARLAEIATSEDGWDRASWAERHGTRPQVCVLDTVAVSRRLGRVTFADDDARLLAAPPAAAKIIAATRRRALTALALEAVGVASQALALGVEHAKSREQFGRPIGAYQAVSHKLADTYVETELARSLAYWAAWCIAED